MVRKVDSALELHGTHRIGDVGEGDVGKGSMEDSFLSWKDAMWGSLCLVTNLDEHEACFEPAFNVNKEQVPESPVHFMREEQQ